MNLHLQVVAGPDKGRAFMVHPGPNLVLGRCHTAYYQVSDPEVSRNHCVLVRDEDKVTVVCNGGHGGTFVNGIRTERRVLHPGDLLQVGRTQLRVAAGDPPDADGDGDADGDAFEVVEEDPEERLENLVGQRLAHYDVGDMIGVGIWSAVFRATDVKDKHPVALKVLRPELSRSSEAVKRFAAVMKSVLPLRHTYLVPVLSAGKTGPYCWVARQAVVGDSLSQVLAKAGRDDPLDWHFGFRAAVQMARALEYAHDKGVIHGHVTPSNVLFDRPSKTFKVEDLMLAQVAEASLTCDIEPAEDLVYHPPERFEEGTEADAASDLYGLGATVYELLTGRPPFKCKTFSETLSRIRDTKPLRPSKAQPELPRWLEAVVMRLLAKTPEERPQSAAEVLEELESAAGLDGVRA